MYVYLILFMFVKSANIVINVSFGLWKSDKLFPEKLKACWYFSLFREHLNADIACKVDEDTLTGKFEKDGAFMAKRELFI